MVIISGVPIFRIFTVVEIKKKLETNNIFFDMSVP